MAGGAGFDGVGADVGEDAPRTMSSKKSMRLFVVSSIMASLLFCCLFAARSDARLISFARFFAEVVVASSSSDSSSSSSEEDASTPVVDVVVDDGIDDIVVVLSMRFHSKSPPSAVFATSNDSELKFFMRCLLSLNASRLVENFSLTNLAPFLMPMADIFAMRCVSMADIFAMRCVSMADIFAMRCVLRYTCFASF